MKSTPTPKDNALHGVILDVVEALNINVEAAVQPHWRQVHIRLREALFNDGDHPERFAGVVRDLVALLDQEAGPNEPVGLEVLAQRLREGLADHSRTPH